MVLFQNSRKKYESTAAPQVLIVDDEPAVREMLAVALAMADFEVTEADNALTALNQVTSSIPDLMLIDWICPRYLALNYAKTAT